MSMFDYSTDGSTWITTLPQPSAINGDGEDLDSDSYRSVANGNLIRNIIGYKWQKIGFTYNYLTEADARTLMGVLRTANNLWIRTKSPLLADATTGFVVLRGYVSKISFDWIQTGNSTGGYTVSFNFVEAKR